MTYKSKLLRKENIAEGTMAFTFERPNGFNFKAGQFLEVTILNSKDIDEGGMTRAFSIANPPSLNELIVATRIRNTAFKRVLKEMPIGTEVELMGPFGSFTIKNKVQPIVFLIGGIGITPVRSIIMDAIERNLGHEIFLFYSNRRLEDSAFMDDLNRAVAESEKLHVIPTMTDVENSKIEWKGEKGYITPNLIKKYVPNTSIPIFFIAGPEQMVFAMKRLVIELGVDEDNVVTEEFSGY